MHSLQDLLAALRAGEAIDLSALTADQAKALRTEALDAFAAAKTENPAEALFAGKLMAAANERIATIASEAAALDEFARIADEIGTTVAEETTTKEPAMSGAPAEAPAVTLPDVGPVTAAGQTLATPPAAPSQPTGPVLRAKKRAPRTMQAARSSYDSHDATSEDQVIDAAFAERVKSELGRGGDVVVGRIASIRLPQGRTAPGRLGNHTADVNNAIMDSYEERYERSLTAAGLTCSPAEIDRSLDVCFGGITSFYDAMPKVPASNCKWSFRPDLGPDDFVAGGGCADLALAIPAGDKAAGITEWDGATSATCNGGSGAFCREHACDWKVIEHELDKIVLCESYKESLERCDPELLAQLMVRHAAAFETYRDRRLLWEFDKAVNDASGWYAGTAGLPGESGVHVLMDRLLTLFESDGSWVRGTDMSDYRIAIPKTIMARFVANELKVGGRPANFSTYSLDNIAREFGFGGLVAIGTDALQEAAPLHPTLAGGTCDAPVTVEAQTVYNFPVRLIPSRMRLAETGLQEWSIFRDPKCDKTSSTMYGYSKLFNRGCVSPKRIDVCLNFNGASVGSIEPAAGAC